MIATVAVALLVRRLRHVRSQQLRRALTRLRDVTAPYRYDAGTP